MRSVIVVSLLLCGVAAGQATNTTTDQSVVQQAYAKAAYALQLTAVYDLYSSRRYYSLNKQVSDADVQAAVAAATVTFQITKIKTGLIGEIANNGILEMIGNPIHPKLSIHSTDQSYSKYCDAASKAQGFTCVKGSQLLTGAQWQPSPNIPPMGTISDMPLTEFLQEDRFDTDYTRYVTYTVRMQYRTQDVTYNALALFGGKGNRSPIIFDGYAEGVTNFLNTEVYPSALLDGIGESRSFPQPAITDWIRNMPTNAACQAGKSCCDTATMKCAIAPSDLQPYVSAHPVGPSPIS